MRKRSGDNSLETDPDICQYMPMKRRERLRLSSRPLNSALTLGHVLTELKRGIDTTGQLALNAMKRSDAAGSVAAELLMPLQAL